MKDSATYLARPDHALSKAAAWRGQDIKRRQRVEAYVTKEATYLARAEVPSPAVVKATPDEVYDVVLREPGGASLVVKIIDRLFYPKVLAWNRLLKHDLGRRAQWQDEAGTWHAHGRRALMEIADASQDSQLDMENFIKAAARSGIVEVQIPWEREEKGWAARLFAWETLLGLATKEERAKNPSGEFLVVRVLSGCTNTSCEDNKSIHFLVTAAAEKRGFDYEAECAAIASSLQTVMEPQIIGDLEGLATLVESQRPRVLHLVLDYQESQQADRTKHAGEVKKMASTVAKTGVELAVFSSCYTGSRLAPLTVANGVNCALGFHGEVIDDCLPVFFGAFYRTWKESASVLAALRAGRIANAAQSGNTNLGIVTLWSSKSLIDNPPASIPPGFKSLSPRSSRSEPAEAPTLTVTELKAALRIDFELETELNYSLLHNRTGGLFKKFVINKVKLGRVPEVEVTVTLDAGVDRAPECHFIASFTEEQGREDLAPRVMLPLGATVLRQRGESMLATVQVSVRCGNVRFFHILKSIKLLPCDEWLDNSSGRHLLPCFVFPRDPAVREILSAAQPFLRALSDNAAVGFDGYQAGFHPSPARAVVTQTRALWSALQFTLRLDYISPPPVYTRRSQRLRTPEEILRSRRATCIETSLLLCSCWEHVSIYPVIFLVRGHAFAGCWLNVKAWEDFLEASIQKAEEQAVYLPETHTPLLGSSDGAIVSASQGGAKLKTPWLFSERHHLEAILSEIEKGALLPLETTFIPLQRPYAEAVINAEERLRKLSLDEFDGMLDLQTAREQGVTPLSIIFQGIVA